MAVSVNPASLEEIKKYPDDSEKIVNDKIANADKAFQKWQFSSFAERKKLILKLAENLNSNATAYGQIITDEMGKMLQDSVAEVKKCATACTYFAENAERFLSDIKIDSEFKESFVTFNPLGVILAVMPWNFPFWQLFRAAVPAILAGNTMVLKHASNVSGSALLIEKIFKDSGFPENIFQTVIVPGKGVEKIIANPLIRGVTFTGSTDVGRKIAETAGKHLKKCVLELGGNDPYIVLGDADVALAAEKCAASRLINGGQSCISAKRFIVNKKVYKDFAERFTALMNEAKFGDPNDKSNKIGPLVSIEARDNIHKIVQQYIDSKAVKLLTGGKVPDIKGAYYPPTVLEVIDNSKIKDIEIFGPVALVQAAESDEECIKIANDSNFGLGAAIFTQDAKRARELASKHVQAGCVFINDFVKSDPRFPFGGIKESGFGRELSEFGIREFTNIKTVIAN